MGKNKVPVMDKIHRDLLVAPHQVKELFLLITGEWQPDSIHQEQMVTHLATCQDCRTALIILLTAAQKLDQMNDAEESAILNILARFLMAHHDIEALQHEPIEAYAEAIVGRGRGEADKQFPHLVRHINKCPSCKFMLDELLAFLNEAGFPD